MLRPVLREGGARCAVRCGAVRVGALYGVLRYAVVLCGAVCSVLWYGVVRCMVCCGVLRHAVVRYGVVCAVHGARCGVLGGASRAHARAHGVRVRVRALTRCGGAAVLGCSEVG